MILDKLENADRYFVLHPGFARAFTFLRRGDLGSLQPGRHEIDGDRIYAMVIRGLGRGLKSAKREAHRKYIDIQFSVAGTDMIGWKYIETLRGFSEGYMADKDAELFKGDVDAWVAVVPGNFAVYFPEDVHAPMGGEGELHKVVVKVLVDSM